MKERIIGAIVLVAVVVLVVPVFLDGPPEEGEILSERVPLPGQDDQETRTVVLDRNRTDPVPATSAAAEPEAETRTVPEQASPAEKEVVVARQETTSPEPEEEPAPAAPQKEPPQEDPPKKESSTPAATPATAASSTGMFAVQLGSFSNKQNAEQLAADLRKQGFAAFLSQLDTGSAQLQRVRIGPQKDRQAAEAMAERLKKAGHTGQVVPHP